MRRHAAVVNEYPTCSDPYLAEPQQQFYSTSEVAFSRSLGF